MFNFFPPKINDALLQGEILRLTELQTRVSELENDRFEQQININHLTQRLELLEEKKKG